MLYKNFLITHTRNPAALRVWQQTRCQLQTGHLILSAIKGLTEFDFHTNQIIKKTEKKDLKERKKNEQTKYHEMIQEGITK